MDSTNAEALRRLPGFDGPGWIVAGEQTAGRGRRSRPWISPRGNFHGTLVCRPTSPPELVALRSFVAALALRDTLARLTGFPEGITLKWPNDLLLNGGKVAGILLEGSGFGGPDPVLCIGFGVNLIAAPEASAVEPGAVSPVSVLSETGKRLLPERVLDHLAPAFASWETRLRDEGFAPVRDAWLSSAARLGEMIQARTGRQTHTGRFETVDMAGNLILLTSNGPLAIPAADIYF